MASESARADTGWSPTSTIDVPASPGEADRLDQCVLEPIHIPGIIQPHGVLLSVDPQDFRILQASSSTAELFGVEATSLLGKPLAALIGEDAVAQLRGILDWDAFADNPMSVVVAGARFDAIIHESGDVAIVEFEPAAADGSDHAAPAIYAAIHRLAGASTVEDLHAWTVRELRRLTQFDRVMVYRFHPDEHGEVVAEATAEGMEPYLGLHFPASDVPIQARRLYLTKVSRVIVTNGGASAELIPTANPLTGAPLDLSRAELRGISDSHLQFMRNMQQASTMSFSLVHNGELIGMITCAHNTAKRIPYLLRQGYEVLANQVALQLGAMEEIERLTRRDEVRTVRAELGKQIVATPDLAAALLDGRWTILDLVRAEGATVHLDGRSTTIGRAPVVERTDELFAMLRQRTNGLPFVTEALAIEHPEIGVSLPSVGGLVLVPFGAGKNYIAWFRPEITQTINWLGDQSPDNRATPLSPRNSFSSWSESVTGRAQPWDASELMEAAELCRDLNAELLARYAK